MSKTVEIRPADTHNDPLVANVHPDPTQAEALNRAAGAYMRSRATPRVGRILERFMAWRR